MNEALGRAVLDSAVDVANELFGERLIAAYALGSLAHGGFSDLVSDVDVGLILADPLAADDAAPIDELSARVRASGPGLAERLSVFWGTPSSLRGDAIGGRFPPPDRLDLLESGVLLAGREARAGAPAPSYRELATCAAETALRALPASEVAAEVADPRLLVAAGPRRLTKRILFPVRFLYTLRTGRIGPNQDAVEHFAAANPGPAADLASVALRWRTEPPAQDSAQAIAFVTAGMVPLFGEFLDDLEQRLAEFGERELATGFTGLRAALER